MYVETEAKSNLNVAVISNLQTNFRLKLGLPKLTITLKASNLSTAHHKESNCISSNVPIEYPVREYKFDMKESDGNT